MKEFRINNKFFVIIFIKFSTFLPRNSLYPKLVDEEDLDEEAEDAAQIEEIEIEAMEAEVLLIL